MRTPFPSLLLAAAMAATGVAEADVVYTTVPNAAGRNATAEFDFNASAGGTTNLTLTLTNTSNVVDISHVLDDFHFTLSGLTTGSLTGLTGTSILNCTTQTCVATAETISADLWLAIMTDATDRVDLYAGD